MIRSAVLEHDVCYLMSRRMDREYLTYQRPPIACHSMRLGEGITFMNHAPSGGVASSSTTPASIRRARGPDAPLPMACLFSSDHSCTLRYLVDDDYNVTETIPTYF